MREAIEVALNALTAWDTIEEEHIKEVREWVISGAPLCRMAASNDPPQHLCCYYLPIDFQKRRLLLGDHRKSGLWLPGGGHVELGESPVDCVRREMKEEIGLDWPLWKEEPFFLSICRSAGGQKVHSDVLLWYPVIGSCDVNLQFDRREFSAMRWFSPEALPQDRMDRHLTRFLEKWESRIGCDA